MILFHKKIHRCKVDYKYIFINNDTVLTKQFFKYFNCLTYSMYKGNWKSFFVYVLALTPQTFHFTSTFHTSSICISPWNSLQTFPFIINDRFGRVLCMVGVKYFESHAPKLFSDSHNFTIIYKISSCSTIKRQMLITI